MREKKKKLLKRVDIQVSLLVACMVVCSCSVVFFIVYSLSYNEMIRSLSQRVDSIARYVDEEMDQAVFTEISGYEDRNTPLYKETHKFLESVKEISAAKYLYTAIRNEDGELIYHIDGLPYDDPDFRDPGDLIEPDFQEDLTLALTDTIVMPDDILQTTWGDVFVAYYPLHNSDKEVVGVVGVEFPADDQFNSYFFIRMIFPFIILLTCIISIFLSKSLFRRISNPHYRDIFNTDSLTSIKNRNAFDVDTFNLIQRNDIKGRGIVLADLNGLKKINDELGHKKGDLYIKLAATSLSIENFSDHVVYRIGGDEFATVFNNCDEKTLKEYIKKVKENLKKNAKDVLPQASVSMGYSICDGDDIEAWEKAQHDADEQMYIDKKRI